MAIVKHADICATASVVTAIGQTRATEPSRADRGMYRSRLLHILIITVALVAAACGGGGDDEPATRAEITDESTTTTTTTEERGEPEATDPSTDTTTVPIDGAETTPTTAEHDAGRDRQEPTASEARPSVPAPVPAGTYRYRQSGSFTYGTTRQDIPPEGTLVADPPASDGMQRLHRYVDPDRPPSETTMRFAPEGVFLVETVQRAEGMEFRCRFDDPGLPVPPWPPRVGGTFAGRADCGQITVEVEGRVTEEREATVGDDVVHAYVIESTITTSGTVESTTHQVDWYAPSLQLSVRSETDMRGKMGAFSFTADTVSELISTDPV